MLSNLRHWLETCAFNRNYWKLIRTASKAYPYDYEFFMRISKSYFKYMSDYFKKHDITTSDAENAWWLDICCKLIDIIGENPTKNKVYINQKNINRFIEPGYDGIFKLFPQELRVQKAKHLLFKILNQKIFGFWN